MQFVIIVKQYSILFHLSFVLLIVERVILMLNISELSGSFCGNSVVEKDEQCDVGAEQGDKCCDHKCQLRPKAKCRQVTLHISWIYYRAANNNQISPISQFRFLIVLLLSWDSVSAPN